MSAGGAKAYNIGGYVVLVPLCGAKLHRCCGEGPLVCEKPVDHGGPHEDEGVCWG